MVKDDKVMLEKYKKRIKDQNNAAKENWDTVSCRLPKGTKDRIRALGLSVNGVINDCVLKFLKEQEQNNAGLVQNEPQATESKESSANDKSIEPTKNIETGADNDTDKMLKLQEEIESRRTEREEFKKSNTVVQEETAKEKNKPVNNIDDALTKQLNAIRERREKAKNKETDGCPF